MKDRRPVDELTVEELEQILAIKKREQREARLRKMRASGRAGRAQVIETVTAPPSPPKPKSRAGRVFNSALLLAEIAVVGGLIFVLINATTVWQTLNGEVAQALAPTALPTPMPTPILTAVVLPSGHTPPTSEGGAQFNLAEIPERLRPLIQSLPPVPIPTPSPGQATRLVIPAISQDIGIVLGDAWEQLKRGVGQNIDRGVVYPGQPGNMVLSAHNDIYGEYFRDLDRLGPGDEITVYSQTDKFVYVVTGRRIVEPTEVSVMDPTISPTLTLISCYPYLVDTQRIVVFGELKR
jgi:sortase A